MRRRRRARLLAVPAGEEHTRFVVGSAAVGWRRAMPAGVLVLLVLAGCGDIASPSSTTTTTVSTRPAPVTTTSTTIGTRVVPNVVGKDLVTARAVLAAAGFNRITPHDGTQRKRTPADDWVVYRQSPTAGESVLTSVYIYLDLLAKGERYRPPDTSPCPRFAQC